MFWIFWVWGIGWRFIVPVVALVLAVEDFLVIADQLRIQPEEVKQRAEAVLEASWVGSLGARALIVEGYSSLRGLLVVFQDYGLIKWKETWRT